MAEKQVKGKNSAISEISSKIRLLISIIIFVILTLLAVIVRYIYPPAAAYLDFVPEVTFNLVVGITILLAVLSVFLSLGLSRQVFRIISDYSNRLEKILDITRDLREEVYGDILLEKIMDYALSITRSDAGSILLIDNNGLTFKIVRGGSPEKLLGTSVKKGMGICGFVAETGRPVRIQDTSKDERFNAEIDSFTGYDTKSVLCVPLKASTGVVGVLELLNKKGGHTFRERDEEIVSYLAEQAAISIIKTRFVEDQKNYEIHLTEILLEAMDIHLSEKKDHSRRVARFSNIMAKGLNMSEGDKKRLYFASLLHDVGFLKISADESFNKEAFMRHPVIGYEMIKPINFYSDISLFILHHHERYDGNGYPSRLKGEDIPLEARIIAIAEAFDAMTSKTSYKVPLNFDDAVEELKRNADTQFDPELVNIFANNIQMVHIK